MASNGTASKRFSTHYLRIQVRSQKSTKANSYLIIEENKYKENNDNKDELLK